MQLGWIDFSESERNKVIDVLDLLSQDGTLDELGIAAVRDGFANIFFPGTSTIQTRAKYFFLVPYIAKDMERSNVAKYSSVSKAFNDKEKACAILLKDQEDADGVIGRVTLGKDNKNWVKRTPAQIYWNGLRRYGFFLGNESLGRYIDYMCSIKADKLATKMLGNRSTEDDAEQDDTKAGDSIYHSFWNVPTYSADWFNYLNIKLTAQESEFLKTQIISNCAGSLLAEILKNDWTDIFEFMADGVSFEKLGSFIQKHKNELSSEMQEYYLLANDFSNFMYAIRIMYNKIASQNKNEEANERFVEVKANLDYYTKVDLNRIFSLRAMQLYTARDSYTFDFLQKAKAALSEAKFDILEKIIIAREIDLKGENRAKTYNHQGVDPNTWYSGYGLDYRLGNTLRIIRDIYENEGKQNA